MRLKYLTNIFNYLSFNICLTKLLEKQLLNSLIWMFLNFLSEIWKLN